MKKTKWRKTDQGLPGLEPQQEQPPRPAAVPVSTSIQAAEAIQERAPELRQRVLDHIRSCGDEGATRPEIAAALGIGTNTVNPRCNELLGGKDKKQHPVLIYQTSESRGGCKVLRARRSEPVHTAAQGEEESHA